MKIVEERSPAVVTSDLPDHSFASHFNRHNFKHVRDEALLKAVMTVCHLLGFYGSLMVLSDHLLDIIHQSKLHRKEAILVLNEIVSGYSSSGLIEGVQPGKKKKS